MNSLIRNSFDKYFNNILRTSLGYSETFTISINGNRISLYSDKPSELIRTLWTSESTLNKIKDTLLLAFQRNNPDISEININLISNREMEIIYNFSISSITELGLSANVLKEFSLDELSKWCALNKQLSDQCKSQMFWVQLFNARFGELPKWLPQNINYRKFYIDILKYLESIPVTEELINIIEEYQQYLIENDVGDLEFIPEQFHGEYKDVLDFFNNLNEYSVRYLIENKVMTMQDIITMMVVLSLHNSKHAQNVKIIESLIENYDLYFKQSKYFYPDAHILIYPREKFWRENDSFLLFRRLFEHLLEHYFRTGEEDIKLVNKFLHNKSSGKHLYIILGSLSRIIREIGTVHVSDELISILENYISLKPIPIDEKLYQGSLRDYINITIENFNKKKK